MTFTFGKCLADVINDSKFKDYFEIEESTGLFVEKNTTNSKIIWVKNGTIYKVSKITGINESDTFVSIRTSISKGVVMDDEVPVYTIDSIKTKIEQHTGTDISLP